MWAAIYSLLSVRSFKCSSPIIFFLLGCVWHNCLCDNVWLISLTPQEKYFFFARHIQSSSVYIPRRVRISPVLRNSLKKNRFVVSEILLDTTHAIYLACFLYSVFYRFTSPTKVLYFVWWSWETFSGFLYIDPDRVNVVNRWIQDANELVVKNGGYYIVHSVFQGYSSPVGAH